ADVQGQGIAYEILPSGFKNCPITQSVGAPLFSTSGSKTFFHSPQLLIEASPPLPQPGPKKAVTGLRMCTSIEGPSVPFSYSVALLYPLPSSSALDSGLPQWSQC